MSDPQDMFRGQSREQTRRWAPARVGNTLEQFLEHMGAPPVRTLVDLVSRWPDVVGPGLAEHSRPIEVIDGVLTVGCDDATWASQLQWMDAQIKQRCSTVFDGLEVVRVAIRVTG